jgi:cobalt-zinc-cadmium efflux system outer membrane protein
MKSRFLFLLFSVPLFWYRLTPPTLAQAASGEKRIASDSPATLALAQALARVFARNPELQVSELEIQAASARVSQAGVKPNPEITAEAENLSTFGGAGLFQYTESTLQVSQRLELGGKRGLRIRAAEKNVTIATSQLEVKKADLVTATSQAFADVLAEQERVRNQEELSRLARQSHLIVVERVAAGKVSPVEQTRAAVALASAQLEEEKGLRALVAAKDRLAALWGGSYREIEAVQGSFAIPLVRAETLAACLMNNPDLKLAAAAVESRDAALALELASRKPDLTFSAGFRRLSLDDKNVLVAGISIPLTIFDKRQGAIAEARIRLSQSRSEQQAAELRLHAGLTQARHDHEIALLEAAVLTESALPAAREAAAAIEEGYRLGKFDFLNVLDAQRTFAELQGKFIEAVATGIKAAIEIERLARCDSQTTPANPAR